jgi:DNA-binding protein H-NS
MTEQEVREEPAVRTQRLVFNADEATTTPSNMKEVQMEAPDDPTSDMTLEDLQRQQDEIQRKILEKQQAEKRAVIEQIVSVVHSYDIPIDELVDALGGLKIKRKGQKAIQKYRDPASGATWSGRGKEPVWIRGKDREQFLIADAE